METLNNLLELLKTLKTKTGYKIAALIISLIYLIGGWFMFIVVLWNYFANHQQPTNFEMLILISLMVK